MDICKIAVKRLMPAGYNPRIDLQPDDEDYKNLQKSIDAFGYIEPIIWNERTGHVVGGHQRLKILIAKGYSEIEVSRIDVSEEDEKLLNVALNKITGRWDMDKLEDLLRDIQDSDGNILLTGFSQEEVDDILHEFRDADFMDFFAEKPKEASCTQHPCTEPQDEPQKDAGDKAFSNNADTPEKAGGVRCPNCGEWVKV